MDQSPFLPQSELRKLRKLSAAELAEQFDPEELEHILEALYDLEDLDCAKRIVSHSEGVMYWLRNHTRTENYHWEAQGLQPKEPFPYKPFTEAYLIANSVPRERWHLDYLDVTMEAILASFQEDKKKKKPLYIAKTREMLTSWLVVGYITWACQFFPNIEAVGQSEKDDKAQGLIKYANILYDNQEGWLKQRHPLKRGDTGTKHIIEWANGSSFTAIPQGERQTASKHPTIYFNDESAHQPAWEATINVVKPVAKQIICVSSAAASRFGDLCAPPVK